MDVLLEWGLESQADCARWAATTCELKDFETEKGGVFPYPWNSPSGWKWTAYQMRVKELYQHRIPDENWPPTSAAPIHAEKDITGAILWLLDNWKPA